MNDRDVSQFGIVLRGDTFSQLMVVASTLGIFLLMALSMSAATYYVATNGSNSNSCAQAQSTSTPKRNISGGSGGISCLSAGDTLYIRAGSYAEAIGNNGTYPPSGTSWTNPVTIAGYPGETVTLTGSGSGVVVFSTGIPRSYLILDNLILDAINLSGPTVAFYIGTDSHHIRFQNGEIKNGWQVNVQGGASYLEILNSKIHDAGKGNCAALADPRCYGFYMTGHDNLFEGNDVYNNSGYGFHIFNSGHTDVSNNIIRNNRIHNNGLTNPQNSSGILLSSGSNNQAYNNLVYQNFQGLQGSLNYFFYNNTVYNNLNQGIVLGATSSSAAVRNNIFYGNGGTAIDDQGRGTAGVTLSNNLCGSLGTGCSVVGNPQFLNAFAPDFHLTSISPAVDAGVTISTVTKDFDNVSRPQGCCYDIGAFQYQASQLSIPQNLRITSITP
jgi:parallel beta-helix repeat protein